MIMFVVSNGDMDDGDTSNIVFTPEFLEDPLLVSLNNNDKWWHKDVFVTNEVWDGGVV